jgi:hypothetical protein
MPCFVVAARIEDRQLPRFAPLDTMPLRYAMSSAGRSATERAAERFESASVPPIFSFNVTNSRR